MEAVLSLIEILFRIWRELSPCLKIVQQGGPLVFIRIVDFQSHSLMYSCSEYTSSRILVGLLYGLMSFSNQIVILFLIQYILATIRP